VLQNTVNIHPPKTGIPDLFALLDSLTGRAKASPRLRMNCDLSNSRGCGTRSVRFLSPAAKLGGHTDFTDDTDF
jgi:hypothetical protein